VVDESEVQRRIQSLTEKELRALGLLSLGWENEQIAAKLHLGLDGVKSRLNKAGRKLGIRGRVALAVFYVDHILPTDTLPGYAPGEKLVVWRRRAEKRRAQLKAAGVLTPEVVAAAMLLTNPEHASKTSAELGALMRGSDGKPLAGDNFKTRLVKISKKSPGGSRNRAWIAVIARLAPFDAV